MNNGRPVRIGLAFIFLIFICIIQNNFLYLGVNYKHFIMEDNQIYIELPGYESSTIDTKNKTRKRVKELARSLANSNNPKDLLDYENGITKVTGNKARLFKRAYRKQDKQNKEYTAKLERDNAVIQSAKEGTLYPEQFGKWIATKRDESPITQKFVMPLVMGSAFGPAGAIAALSGESVNTGVKGASKGLYDTWGEWLTGGSKGWSSPAEFTNPGYLIAGPIAINKTGYTWRTGNGSTVRQNLQNAINQEIKDFTNSTNHFGPRVKPLSKPISEAERLGIPKGERSNPKALEDPQYWGYQQWNQRYNAAIESGNVKEVQRLRDLHFKIKAPDTKVVDENGMPLHTYHGSMKHFTIFNNVNPKDIKLKTGGYHTADYNLGNSVYGKGGYYNPINGKFFRKDGIVYDNYLNITNPFIDTPNHNISDIVGKLTRGNEYPNWGSLNGSGRVFIKNGGFDGVFVPRYHNTYLPTNSASQIKSADPITWNGKGEIIPIVKRDNFHNPDIRYKQGGILKGQTGMVLGSALLENFSRSDAVKNAMNNIRKWGSDLKRRINTINRYNPEQVPVIGQPGVTTVRRAKIGPLVSARGKDPKIVENGGEI